MEVSQVVTANPNESVLYLDSSVTVTQHCRTAGISVNGIPIHFTEQEVTFLLYLIEGNGQVRSKAMLLAKVKIGERIDYKIVDVLACRIRKKLRKVSSEAEKLVRLVWGRGYSWGTLNSGIPAETWNPHIPNPIRWTPLRKFELVGSLLTKQVSEEEVLRHHSNLSRQELLDWKRNYADGGAVALRVTCPNLAILPLAA